MRSFIQFQERTAIFVVDRSCIQIADRTLANVSRIPHGNRVALDKLTNCRADSLDEMIAGSQSIGACDETVLLDRMTGWQGVDTLHPWL